MGWVNPGEIRWVATLSDRMGARKYAKQVGGKQAADVLQHYQQALTEMAFLHNRVVSGTAPADFNQRMYEIQQRAALLRPAVILPPVQQPRPLYGGPSGPTYGPPGSAPNPNAQWSPIPGTPLQPGPEPTPGWQQPPR